MIKAGSLLHWAGFAGNYIDAILLENVNKENLSTPCLIVNSNLRGWEAGSVKMISSYVWTEWQTV